MIGSNYPLNWEGETGLFAIGNSLSSNGPFQIEIAGFWVNELRILYFNTYIFLCKVLILYILMTILSPIYNGLVLDLPPAKDSNEMISIIIMN